MSEKARELAAWFVKHYGLESEEEGDDGTCLSCISAVDQAVAPLVELGEAADYLICGLHRVAEGKPVRDLDKRYERYRTAREAFKGWKP